MKIKLLVTNLIFYFVISFFIFEYLVTNVFKKGYTPVYSILTHIQNQDLYHYNLGDIFQVVKLSVLTTLVSTPFFLCINKWYGKRNNKIIFLQILVLAILIIFISFAILCITLGMYLYFMYALFVLPILINSVLAIPIYWCSGRIISSIFYRGK